jgi:hypothetical protein
MKHEIQILAAPSREPDQGFLLRRAQRALTGSIDDSLSSLSPIFAVALATATVRPS